MVVIVKRTVVVHQCVVVIVIRTVVVHVVIMMRTVVVHQGVIVPSRVHLAAYHRSLRISQR